ncbi:hypothetical protein [Anaerococcus nagyae]|uniref:hypothetical protein n=2 Tax=Anaerococcus TaxID=165779 RepID=UPI003243C63C
MDRKFKNLAHIVFEKIYYYLIMSLMYVVSIIAGLVFLTFGGSHVLLYKLNDKLSHERYKEKIKVFKFFKKNFISFTKKYIKVSILYVSLILILAVDIFYFSTSISPIFTALFYLILILSFIIINAIELSFLLMAKYSEMTFRDVAQNSISLIIVNIVDVLFLDAIVALVAIVIYKISDILLIILFPGIFIDLSYYIFNKMLDKKSISYLLFNIK